MPTSDPDKIRLKLEKDGIEEVKKKLNRGAYAKFKVPTVKEWLQEKEQTLEPKPPKILQNIKWLELHWKQYLKYIVVAVICLLIIFIFNKINLFNKSIVSNKTNINRVEGDYVGRDKNITINPPKRTVKSVECKQHNGDLTCPLKLAAYSHKEPHVNNSEFAEIKWKETDVDVRVSLTNNSGKTIHDISFVIESETNIRKISQLTQVPDVTFAPYSRFEHTTSLVMRDEKGNEHLEPFNPSEILESPGYKIFCPKLLNNSSVEIVMANIAWDYSEDGKTKWIVRKLPRWTRIFGTYETKDIDSHIKHNVKYAFSLQKENN